MGFSVLGIDDRIVRSISEVEADKEMSVRVSDGMVYGPALKDEGLCGKEESDGNDLGTGVEPP